MFKPASPNRWQRNACFWRWFDSAIHRRFTRLANAAIGRTIRIASQI